MTCESAGEVGTVVDRLLGRLGKSQLRRHLGRQLTVDPRELCHDRRTDLGHFHLAEFEGERGDDVFGFSRASCSFQNTRA